MHGHELSKVVASHCQSRGILAMQESSQSLQRSEVVCLELENVVCPELGGMNETPLQPSLLQLELLHDLQCSELNDLLSDGLVIEEIADASEGQAHNLLHAAVCEHILELLRDRLPGSGQSAGR